MSTYSRSCLFNLLDSTYCYLLAPVEHRDAETWGIHLLELAEQGLQPNYTLADGGRGLRAGQALAWPEVPCNGDVFHGLRELTRLSATLERRAYAAITRREALKRQMDKAKHRRQGSTFSTRLARARAHELTAIRLASEVRILSEWMQHDILALAGPDAPTRQSLYDFVMECLQALEALDAKRIRPVRQTLVNQRDSLLAFATRLDQELQALALRFAVPVARLRELLVLQTLPTTTPDYYWQRAGELHRVLQGQFHPLQRALLELRAHLHRASSLVENFNSRLRNYFFLRRQIGPRYLDLLRFFLNHHPFTRSQQPHRVGKTPAELLTGQAHPHWLEMLGFTRFQRVSQTAQLFWPPTQNASCLASQPRSVYTYVCVILKTPFLNHAFIGVVHLWGLVRSDQEKKALHIAAQSIAGVRAVEDHLGKLPPGGLGD